MNKPAELIGARLGAYDIQGLLGSGGAANVYRAFDNNLQRAVAIKVLSPAAAAEPGFVDRFRQEARLIANLRHPHIVQVYDLGQQAGFTYMVQELLAGPTLEAWVRDLAARGTPPSPQQIIQVVAQLADALDAAHAAGIIHRDVKPANALWKEPGTLVLTDFGIAKQISGGANHTQFGMVFGTPSYLSPEQAQGLQLTPASDIYSLGVVLYELIAGRIPFRSNTPMRAALDHIQTPPPPLPPRPDLRPEVEAVVLRALAKDPAARFGSASELAQALTRAWTVEPAAAHTAPATNIHSQATQRWQVARPATPAATSVPTLAEQALGAAPAAPVPAPSPAPLPGQRSRPLLPALGALLVLLLLGGALLAARGANRPADTALGSATSAPTSAGIIQPATEPTQLPTPSAADPLAELRALLEGARANGAAGSSADELLAELDAAQQALAANNAQSAIQHFTALQQRLLAGAHAGTIESSLFVEAMKRVQSLAQSHGLNLPLLVQFT